MVDVIIVLIVIALVAAVLISHFRSKGSGHCANCADKRVCPYKDKHCEKC